MIDTGAAELSEDPCTLLRTAMLDPRGLQDPYPLLRALHKHGEMIKTPDGITAVFGYDRVVELMRSPKFLKADGRVLSPAFTTTNESEFHSLQEASQGEAPFLVALNPPDHSRVRNIANKGFLPSHLSALKAVIQSHTERLLSAIDPKRPIDIVASFSSILAPEIVGELIGLPAEHRQKVADLSSTFMRGLDPGASFQERMDASHARRQQADYVREVIADRRRAPREDFVTTLIIQSDSDGRIGEAELVSLLQILYIGGYETTSHMIGNGLVALFRNPEQFALLRSDLSLMRAAVDEMLRYDGPISLTQVVAAEGAELGGEPAEVGTTYIGLLAAANHDPSVFEHPEMFNIQRPRRGHLAFGGGIHFCIGAGLARLELEVVFTQLLRLFPRMRLADTSLSRIPAFHQRAYQAVWLTLEPDGEMSEGQ